MSTESDSYNRMLLRFTAAADPIYNFNFFMSAANQGNINALFLVILNGVVEYQSKRDFQRLHRAAEQGNVAAQDMMRTMALEGLATPGLSQDDFVTPPQETQQQNHSFRR